MALDVKALNEKTSKGSLITLLVVCGLILATVLTMVIVLVKSNITEKSTKLFEDAFVEILDFDQSTNIYTKQEKENDIIEKLDRVIASYPNTVSGARAIFYKAYIYYSVEKYDKAIEFFSYFVNKKSNSALLGKAIYFLSYSYEVQGNEEQAIEVLDSFVAKNPKSYYNPLINYRLGSLYEGKDNAKAISYYKKIVDAEEDSSQKDMAKKRIMLLENNLVF